MSKGKKETVEPSGKCKKKIQKLFSGTCSKTILIHKGKNI